MPYFFCMPVKIWKIVVQRQDWLSSMFYLMANMPFSDFLVNVGWQIINVFNFNMAKFDPDWLCRYRWSKLHTLLNFIIINNLLLISTLDTEWWKYLTSYMKHPSRILKMNTRRFCGHQHIDDHFGIYLWYIMNIYIETSPCLFTWII